MKRFLFVLALSLSFSPVSFAKSLNNHVPLSYDDVQLCTNAYNQLWFTFETVKNKHQGDTTQQATIFNTEFPKVADQNIVFTIANLPGTTVPIVITGVGNLSDFAASIGNYGEHHVATPFSVALSSRAVNSRVYSMTTRDVDYTRDATPTNVPGGCTIYLSQKDITCTVTGTINKVALINKLTDNVVASYPITAPNCGVWNYAPVTPYIS